MTDPGRNICLTLQCHPNTWKLTVQDSGTMIGDAGQGWLTCSLLCQVASIKGWVCLLGACLVSRPVSFWLTLSWYLCVQAVVFSLSIRPDRRGHSGDIGYIFLDNLRTT